MSENDSEVFEQPWDDAPEEVLPAQGEYDLVVTSYEVGMTKEKIDKPTRRMVTVHIRIEAPTDYQGINHFLVFPNRDEWIKWGGDSDSERTAKFMLKGIRRFARVFKLSEKDLQGEDLSILEGARGTCLVTHQAAEKGNEIYPQLRLPRAQD